MPQPVMLKKLKLNGSMKVLVKLTPKKDVLFIIGDWNVKVGSQELTGLTGKFDLGVQNEAGQRLRVLPRATREAHVYTKNSISLCPASFHIPRPNLPVTTGVS